MNARGRKKEGNLLKPFFLPRAPFFAPLDIANLFCKAFNLASKVTEFVGVSSLKVGVRYILTKEIAFCKLKLQLFCFLKITNA